VNLEPETLARIARFQWTAGIKEASGSITQIAETVRLCPECAVYCGDDGIALPAFAVGCAGLISVAANVRPERVAAIWKHRKSPLGLKLFQAEQPFNRALFREVNPIPVKFALASMGLCNPEVRLPLTVASPETKDILKSLLTD
jgi:dihydrodipicolinate synthase/N-acetylneuraminate lyase